MAATGTYRRTETLEGNHPSEVKVIRKIQRRVQCASS
jgi:hypothetical protein